MEGTDDLAGASVVLVESLSLLNSIVEEEIGETCSAFMVSVSTRERREGTYSW